MESEREWNTCLFTDIRSGRRSRHLSITRFWIFRKNKQLTNLLNIPAFVDSPTPSWTPRFLHKYNFYTCHDYVNLGGKKIYANMLQKLFFYTGFNASLHDFYVQFINNKIWVCVCKFYKKIFKVKRGRSVFFFANKTDVYSVGLRKGSFQGLWSDTTFTALTAINNKQTEKN